MHENFKTWAIAALATILLCGGCLDLSKNEAADAGLGIEPRYYLETVQKLTDIVVHDIFSPPVASRVYVYPCVAAYEIIAQSYDDKPTFAGRLSGLTGVPEPGSEEVNFQMAALVAFIHVGKTLIFSAERMEAYEQELMEELAAQCRTKTVMERSIAHGKAVAEHILRWAEQDNYKESRSYPKYNVTDDPGIWKPTPPAYMEAIEPHWRTIRTMVIDSAQQFRIEAPPQFSTSETSEFMAIVDEVYQAVIRANDEQKKIASFWDCNPYVMNQRGHLMFATKKITPGGHWMGITGIACRKAELSLPETVEVHALTSIALFDAFIACWDEKYRSNYVRPETFINEYVDDQWVPILQTPPFPEHTSGHSVISTAAAVVLTDYFGANFEFTDDVEVVYGLPERTFSSFIEASQEAAISRLYGGIHYMPAIEEGVKQGKMVGTYIVEKLGRADQLGSTR